MHQCVVHFVGRVGVGNGITVRADHRARVQPRIHLHNAHARFLIARFNGALNRRGTPPARQQRGMDIQAAVARRVQNLLRQNQPVGRHHHHIGIYRTQQRQSLIVAAQLGRLGNGQPQIQRRLFHGRCLLLHAAAFRAVGLGEDERDVKSGSGNGTQGGGGKIGRSGKDDFHRYRLSEGLDKVQAAFCVSGKQKAACTFSAQRVTGFRAGVFSISI